MDSHEDDWTALLNGHPIFSVKDDSRSELSSPLKDGAESACGRRQTMVIKDTELIVAVNDEIRVTSLKEQTNKSYKV